MTDGSILPAGVERPGWRLVTPLVLAAVLNPVNSSILAVALVTIGHAFDAGAAETANLVAALYIACTISQPVMGKFAERFGPRRVMLVGQIVVLAGGVIGTVGVNMPMLVIARVLIGIGTSTGYPASMVVVRRWAERRPAAEVAGTLGVLAVAGGVVGAVGLPLGGALIAVGGWRMTFAVNLPVAVIALVLTWLWVPRDAERRVGPGLRLVTELDAVGIALFTAAVLGLLVFLDGLRHPRWLLAALVILLVAGLVWWERRAAHPFIDVRMLARNRPLVMTYLRIVVTFLASYAVMYGLTQWLEQSHGLSAVAVGVLMLPMNVVGVVLGLMTSRRTRVGGPLLATAIATLAGSAGLLLLSAESPLWLVVAVTACFGVAMLGMVGNQAALYQQAPAEQLGVAAGLLRTFFYLGSILSSSLIGLSFGDRATDGGMHTVGIVLVVVSVLLVIITLTGLRQLRATAGPES